MQVASPLSTNVAKSGDRDGATPEYFEQTSSAQRNVLFDALEQVAAEEDSAELGRAWSPEDAAETQPSLHERYRQSASSLLGNRQETVAPWRNERRIRAVRVADQAVMRGLLDARLGQDRRRATNVHSRGSASVTGSSARRVR